MLRLWRAAGHPLANHTYSHIDLSSHTPDEFMADVARNEPVLVVCLHFTDASLYELTSLVGFDCIWMDLEHHGYSVETASQLMRATRVGGTDIVARPAKGEFLRSSRLLEMGATGIMYPRCESAAEAAEVVKWCKFAPQGRRGIDQLPGEAVQ